MFSQAGAYDPVKGCDNMDRWEDTIEQYKRELVRYAKENGTFYGVEDEKAAEPKAEQQAEPHDEPEPKQDKGEDKIAPPEGSDPTEEIPVWKRFKKDRPMPAEYAGGEAQEDITATLLDEPESDELTEGSEREYGSLEEFTKENPATGMLRIQTFAAQQAFPVVNAKIEVEKDFADGTHRFVEAYTDINGVVENIKLPTKDKSLSQSPGGVIPYATYTVRVTHPHFAPTEFCQVPIFDGIESLQPVAMVQAAKKQGG